MKTNLRSLLALAAVATLLVTTGCNTVSIRSTEALGVPTFPPNPDPASIAILTAPPSRPNIRLGNVQAEPSNDSVSAAKITAALQKAAAKMGADAVVIVYDRQQVIGAIVTGPWYGRSIQDIEGRVIMGVAIKYQ